MPMNRKLYPDNWDAIALAIKDAANWTCQECGRPCRKPGVNWYDFEVWLYEKFCGDGSPWWDNVFQDTPDGNEERRPQRFTLTVAHLDHNPANCDPTNLRALCSGCHLRYDAPEKGRKAMAYRMRKREERGQLSLLGAIGGAK